MRLIYLTIILCLVSNLLLSSCSNKEIEKPVIKTAVKTKPKKKKKPSTPKANPIRDENVVKRLTAYGKKNPETKVKITTSKGEIIVRLYKDTPLHRANFIMMCKKGFYEKTVFTRCVKGFMAQAGGSFDERHVAIKKRIGRYTVPSEFRKNRYHKKGTIAAARSYLKNPNKRSNPYAFYFVEGSIYNKKTLKKYEEVNKYSYSAEQMDYYLNNPGAAHIDGEHTVFGEIISGLPVVSKLTDVKTDSRDWPKDDLFITKVEVIE